MNFSAALFDDPGHEGDLNPFLSTTHHAHTITGDEFGHQPGFHGVDFNTVFDDCNPAIKALLSDTSSDKAAPTSPPVPIYSLHASASIHDDATSPASGASPPASPLFTPISKRVSLPDVCDVAQAGIKASSFDASSTLFPAPPAPAHASPARSGGASLSSSNTCSEPASPLFKPISETVHLVETPVAVQTKSSDNLYHDDVRCVKTARQDASVCHAPVASIPSGLFPVRAEDIDILSPSFNASKPDTTSQSVKATDATTSLELSPIPASRLVNITRKRKRSLIIRDEALDVSLPQTDSPPATEEAQPTLPSSAEPDTINTTAAVQTNPENVPIKLLDQIAARAVAATIRASPGTNVFAAKPYTKKAKALQNQFSGQGSFAYNGSSTGSYTVPQNAGMQANGFPTQWHPTGMPAAPVSVNPAGFPQTNIYPQQAYIANGVPQETNAWPPSLTHPGFYGPSANMNGNSRQMTGQTVNDQAMAGLYAPPAFPTSGNFRAQPFTVPRNSLAQRPLSNHGFTNAQVAKIRRVLSLLYSQAMRARHVQQPAMPSNQFSFTGTSANNYQPQPNMSAQQAVSASMMSMPSSNPPMARQNWMDSSSLNPQYHEMDGFTPMHMQTPPSLPMQQNLINQNPYVLPAQQMYDCPPSSKFGNLQNSSFECSSSQAPTGSPLSESAFVDNAPLTMEDAASRPSKRRKQSQLTFPDSNEPVEVLQRGGFRETFCCQIDGCNKPISIFRNGAWSVRCALQEHRHIPESPNDEVIVCQWVDGKGKRCLQQTKWANYTRHFSGHLGILVRECEFCGSLQARPSNLTRHYKSCKSFHQQDRKTQEDAWSKLNTRQDFSECEKAIKEKMRNAENRRARRRN